MDRLEAGLITRRGLLGEEFTAGAVSRPSPSGRRTDTNVHANAPQRHDAQKGALPNELAQSTTTTLTSIHKRMPSPHAKQGAEASALATPFTQQIQQVASPVGRLEKEEERCRRNMRGLENSSAAWEVTEEAPVEGGRTPAPSASAVASPPAGGRAPLPTLPGPPFPLVPMRSRLRCRRVGFFPLGGARTGARAFKPPAMSSAVSESKPASPSEESSANRPNSSDMRGEETGRQAGRAQDATYEPKRWKQDTLGNAGQAPDVSRCCLLATELESSAGI